MRALVTGAGGFVGQSMCKLLLSDGWDVHGASLEGVPLSGGTLQDWQRDAVMWHDTDLRDPEDVAIALDAAKPDAVFHLAAISHVPAAAADPVTAWNTNVVAAGQLLDAVATRKRAGSIDPVVVIAGSADEYGAHPAEELPLAETAELRPLSVYAATKVAQEIAALERCRTIGVRVVATRPFSHTGAGQASHFLVPSLVERAIAARDAGAGVIQVGNPDVVRDFLFVEDVTRAYLLLALRGAPGEVYNIASGEGTSVAQLAQLVLRSLQHEARVERDPAMTRPVDIPALVGDASKLTAATGWKPEYTIDMVIDEVVYGEAY